ncbi:MAG: 3-oxoacyl-ACP synthase III family protein [Solirubrobacterales bacterium]
MTNHRATPGITGLGHSVPETIVENGAIEHALNLESGWIEKRTGIQRRRVAGADDTVASLGAAASREAIASSGAEPESIDLVLVSTISPDRLLPNVAPLIARAVGARSAGALDVGAACSGWVSAIGIAAAVIESGRMDRVLVVGVDVMSRFLDPQDRGTLSLFADAAGAALVEAVDDSRGIGPVIMGSDGANGDFITASATAADPKILMSGLDTFREAVRRMSEVAVSAAEAFGCELDEIDFFLFHQANGRVLEAVIAELGLDESRVMYSIRDYGNSSSGTMPLTLDLFNQNERIPDGSLVLLAAFGAGLTWAGTVVEWSAV